MDKHTLIPALLTLALACDPGEVEDRQASIPWQYALDDSAPKTVFDKMAATCGVKGPVWASLTGYNPDVSFKDQYLLGFGFTFYADAKMTDCLFDQMIAYGAVLVSKQEK